MTESRVVHASAPIRICDNGGWTDTWFGGPGRVVNIAVEPGVEVAVSGAEGPEPVMLTLETTGERYSVNDIAIALDRSTRGEEP